MKNNVFAFGDCCRTSINEVKNIASIRFLAPIVKANVVSVLKNETPLKAIPAKFPTLAAVSIGPSFGILA